MSLTIFTKKEDIPKNIKLVEQNDAYFNLYTKLHNTELENEILKVIDKAEFASEKTFIGRSKSFGGLYKECLSTGTKTLLNILNHKDVCFSLLECGDNAIDMLPRITEGYVFWENPITVYLGEEDCEVEYRGRSYTNFYDVLKDIGEEVFSDVTD